MTISFKQYITFMEMSDDATDEQINELFGIFRNNAKIEKLKQDREKLKKDTAQKVNDWRAKRDGKDTEEDDEEEQPKNQQARRPLTPQQRQQTSKAAMGRAAERDWTSNLATESVSKISEFSKMVKLLKKAGITGRKQVHELDNGQVATEFQSDKSEKENIQLMKNAGFEIIASYGSFDLWENDAYFQIQMERSKSFRIASKDSNSTNFRSKVLSQRNPDE